MKKFYSCLIACLCFTLPFELLGQCETFFGNLVINEVMAANDNTAADEFGEYDDWVEIYNVSDEAIDLNGYYLSDSHGGDRTKFAFPPMILNPDEYVIVWCDNQPEQGDLHAAFGLSADGEEIGLYNSDTTSVDYMRFGPLPDDISRGRFPNGTGPFNIIIPTFDAANTNSVQTGLVINEYQSNNESTASDQWGGYDDWIELYNNGTDPINLGGYFLSDKVGEPTQFTFPDTALMPDEYLIIWCDQGLFEPGLHTFFKLGSEGDDIILSDPDTLTVDYVRFGLITADETEGRYPNGTGKISCLLPTFSESNGGTDGLYEAGETVALEFFPNPARDQIRFVSETTGEVIRIYDLTGKTVLTEKMTSRAHVCRFPDLAPGLYVVAVGNARGKLIVK